MEGKRSSNKSQGNYFNWVLSIMLLGLMRMVKGEEVKVMAGDGDLGKRLVETTSGSLDMGSKKLEKMPTGDIIFLVLCLLVLICFIMATIVNLVGVSSDATISLVSLGLIFMIASFVQAYRLDYLKKPFTWWHIVFIILGVLMLIAFIVGIIYTNSMSSSNEGAFKGVMSVASFIVFLIFSIAGCGFPLQIYKKPFNNCKIMCLVLTILIVCGMIGLIVFSFFGMNATSGGYVYSYTAQTEQAAIKNLMGACLPIIMSFLIYLYYPFTLDIPYTVCETCFIILTASVLAALISIFVILDTYTNQIAMWTLLVADVTLTITLLGFLHLKRPFSNFFSSDIIAFTILGIMIMICIFGCIGMVSTNHTNYDRNSDYKIAICVFTVLLLFAFLYYGYRLGIYNSITEIFNLSAKKMNVSNSKVKDPAIRSRESTE